MSEPAVSATVEGGQVGVAGAGIVHIANLYVGVQPPAPAPEFAKSAIPPCPYPGLAYFGPHDSALFFGRDAAITQLETAVAARPMTALVGSSGSGKSSVVLAGLAPRLHARGGWSFTHFRVGTEPDKNPFMALARSIAPLLGELLVGRRPGELRAPSNVRTKRCRASHRDAWRRPRRLSSAG